MDLAQAEEYVQRLTAARLDNRDMKVLQWGTALDNHEPAPRAYAGGFAVRYSNDHTTNVIVLFPDGQLRDATRSIYIVDDGAIALPYYVAGWNDTDAAGPLYLHPFPVNPDGRTRADDGRPIDYTGWQVGPRRAYHLKISNPS